MEKDTIESNVERFCDRIKAMRISKSRTQQQAAIALRISKKRLGSYEEGRAEPPYELLARIAEYYNVTADYLVTGSRVPLVKGEIQFLYDQASRSIKDSVLKLLR